MSPTAFPRLDRRKLRALLEPVVGRSGAELEDLTEQRAGSRRLIRVVVDRDGGVSLDDIAEVTRSVSEALDAYGEMGDAAYVLEVTSPGVDRPLTTPRHWRRATGRLVKATLVSGGEVVGAGDRHGRRERDAAGRAGGADPGVRGDHQGQDAGRVQPGDRGGSRRAMRMTPQTTTLTPTRSLMTRSLPTLRSTSRTTPTLTTLTRTVLRGTRVRTNAATKTGLTAGYWGPAAPARAD